MKGQRAINRTPNNKKTLDLFNTILESIKKKPMTDDEEAINTYRSHTFYYYFFSSIYIITFLQSKDGVF